MNRRLISSLVQTPQPGPVVALRWGAQGMMLLAVLMVTLSTRAQPATSPCDPELETRDDTAYGYRLRGERCEGLYARPLSGNSLRIASFTAALEDFDPSLDVDVSVTWDASPDAGPVQIRAHGLPRRLYYYGWTRCGPPHPSRYTWPRGILAAIRIRGHDVGVLAWHRMMADGVETRLHLPVRVSQQYPKAADSEYQLVLIPGQRLSEVYLRLGPIGPQGRIDAATPGGKALRYGITPQNGQSPWRFHVLYPPASIIWRSARTCMVEASPTPCPISTTRRIQSALKE